jgi:hypothetical protein
VPEPTPEPAPVPEPTPAEPAAEPEVADDVTAPILAAVEEIGGVETVQVLAPLFTASVGTHGD